MEIYGTDYPTPDRTAIRDYTHVMDLAEVHVAALRHMLKSQENAAVNLGTGNGHSVRQVVATVERVTGHRVPVRETERRAGDPPELVADPAKARELLGWRPRHSSLENIVQTAWNWHNSRRPTLSGVNQARPDIGPLGEARSHASAA
ncbi:MAG: hypothetical protein DMG76_09060 [Acidobacteria bacterium]|nr:MAG: hypothetical protein DMG76_09060 [Acidobacteriota bacterium]